ERLAIRGEHLGAGQETGPLRRRARDRGEDDEAADRPERGTALGAVRPLRGQLRPDPLELAADPLPALAVGVGAEIRGIRVAQRPDHPGDRAIDDGLAVHGTTGVALRDRVIGVPERAERLLIADRRPALDRTAASPPVTRT